jgi:hypothetical protein
VASERLVDVLRIYSADHSEALFSDCEALGSGMERRDTTWTVEENWAMMGLCAIIHRFWPVILIISRAKKRHVAANSSLRSASFRLGRSPAGPSFSIICTWELR